MNVAICAAPAAARLTSHQSSGGTSLLLKASSPASCSPSRVFLAAAWRRPSRKRGALSICALAYDEDSVAWLSEDVMSRAYPAELEEGSDELKLPCFPLGTNVYLPGSFHVLNIFEPRYREMYNDILFNGSRRFVVPLCHPVDGRFGTTAVVFYVEDLKEISKETLNNMKYQCRHKIIERVEIKGLVNPEALESRSTYLKVVAKPLKDVDEEEDCSPAEVDVEDMFRDIILLQKQVNELVHFDEELSSTVSARRGDSEQSLWWTTYLWQEFLTQRIMERKQQVNLQMQNILENFLQQEGMVVDDLKDLNVSLPETIVNEINRLHTEFEEDTKQDIQCAIWPFHKMIEGDTHTGRLSIVKEMLAQEKNRLSAKAMLKSALSDE